MPVLPGDRGGLGDHPVEPGTSTWPTLFPTAGPPGPGSVNAGASERGQGNIAAPVAGGVLPIVYGRARVEGRLLWQSINGFYQATFVVAWCTGPINSVAKIWVGNRETTGVADISVTNYTGTSGQTANTVLAQSFPGSPPGAFPYVAYSVITVTSPSTWGSWTDVIGSDVSQFFAEIEGKLVEDTRIALSSTYSTNPVLCLRDFLTSAANGLGIPTTLIDDVNFEAEADKCDVVVSGAPKFSLNLAITQEASALDLIHQIRAAFNCDLYMWGGQYRCFVDVEQPGAAAMDFDTETNCSNVDIQLPELGDTPTIVIVKFPNSALNHQIDSVRAEHPGIAAGTQEAREATYQIDGITTKAQANRVATYLLNISTLGLRVTFLAAFGAINLEYGSKITLTTSDGLAAQDLLVQDLERQTNGMYKVMARQYHADIYDEVAIAADGTIETALPDPFITVPPPSRIVADAGPSYILFQGARVYSETLYGGSSWTTSGTWASVTASKINDGIFATAGTDVTKIALDTPSTGARVILDLGSGNTATFVGCRITSQEGILVPVFGALPFGNPAAGFFEIEYSDDGSTWTTLEGTTYETAASLAMTAPSTQQMAEWDDAGAHRYWSIVATTGGTASFDEIQFLTAVPYRWVKEYRIYAHERNADGSYSGASDLFGDAVLFGVIPVGAGNAQPYLDLSGMEVRLPSSTGYFAMFEGFITTVSTLGIESAPVAFSDTTAVIANSSITTNEVVRSATGAARQTGGPTVAHVDAEQYHGAEITLPSVAASGKFIIAMDSATHTIKASVHGGAFAALGGGASSPLTTKGDLWGFSTVDARLAVGTNGHILTPDSTVALGVKWASPESVVGSAVVLTGAIGSLPAAAAAGRLYLTTDSPFTFLRDTGAAWEYFRHGILCTKTVAADWAWINQGTFTATDSKGVVLFSGSATSADHRLLKRSVGSTPWTKTIGVIFTTLRSDVQLVTFGFRESSSGKLHMFLHGGKDSNVQKFNSYNSYNSNYFTRSSMYTTAPEFWVRLADDGTDRVISISHDGANFAEVHRVTRTDFLTADEVFVGSYNDTGGPTWNVSIFSFA